MNRKVKSIKRGKREIEDSDGGNTTESEDIMITTSGMLLRSNHNNNNKQSSDDSDTQSEGIAIISRDEFLGNNNNNNLNELSVEKRKSNNNNKKTKKKKKRVKKTKRYVCQGTNRRVPTGIYKKIPKRRSNLTEKQIKIHLDRVSVASYCMKGGPVDSSQHIKKRYQLLTAYSNNNMQAICGTFENRSKNFINKWAKFGILELLNENQSLLAFSLDDYNKSKGKKVC